MSKFLFNVASFLYEKYSGELADLTVVFPNRRAGLFFQKYLSQLVERPLFSPNIVTISELISSFSTLRTNDNNSLVISLWDTYTSVTGIDESLDDFFYWGEMLLSDFNDVDKYLIDAEKLFKNIVSLKEIDFGFDFLTDDQIGFLASFWQSILQVRSSGEKSRFLNNWRQLYPVYAEFNKRLKNEGLAYEGMVYREMVASLSNVAPEWEGRKVALVGFNALNNCEKKLFDFLKVNCQANFFWDYDQYYLTKNEHEASFFMNANLKRFPTPEGFTFDTNTFEKLDKIDLVSVPGFSGQAAYASNWLSSNKDVITSSFDNTAVVLCDESLLPSMLSSLPSSVGDLNITMGFPLKNSVVFALLKGLLDIDNNGKPGSSGEMQFYYRNVLALLSNPLIKPVLGDLPDRLSERIQQENKLYITRADLAESDLLQVVFTLPANAWDAKDYFQQIIRQLFQTVPESDPLTKESLYQLYLMISRLHNSLFEKGKGQGKALSKKLFYQLLLRSAEKLAIPFEGEPLSGMQVMGFLETRCLDFDNLIILSFNDDKLPGNQHSHSFIPYTLRKGFDLPVVEQKNAMYAYYFYRLIQRSKKVTLVYDSRTEGLSNGDVSRYATQLKYEASHLTLNAAQGVFNFDSFENVPVMVEKNERMVQQIVAIFRDKTITPTMLNTYLDCRLRFYFRYVEGIRESDDVFEEIDHMVFGRIAHLAMEGLYTPFIGKTIGKDDIKLMIADKKMLTYHLQEALKKEFFKNGSVDMNGKNLLIYDIIEKFILRILQYDLSIAPFELLNLEKEYLSTIDLEVNNQIFPVKIGGTVDRLDKVDGRIRVVDYKTGKSEPTVKSIESLFIPGDKRNKAAFQTMLYAHSVSAQLKPDCDLLPAVYGARAVFSSDFDPVFKLGGINLDYGANSLEFIGRLSNLITEITLVDQPFSQTTDIRKCTHCPYNAICNR